MTTNTAHHGAGVTIEALAVRVHGLEGGLQDVRQSIAQQGREFQSALSLQSDRLTSAIGDIAHRIEKRSEIPWPALSIILAVTVAVGTLAYWPIRENQSDFKDALKAMTVSQTALQDTLRSEYLPRSEIEARAARAKEDRDRMDVTIRDLQGSVFPREVHVQRWLRVDGDIAAVRHDVDLQIGNLQRQIEQLQRAQGDVYNSRDALLDLKARVESLDQEIDRERRTPYPR